MTRQPNLGALKRAYRNLTIAVLMSPLKGRSEVAAKFYALSPEGQEEIEREIDRRASLIADAMCDKLAARGFVEREPSPAVLTRLYRDTLKEFEAIEPNQA